MRQHMECMHTKLNCLSHVRTFPFIWFQNSTEANISTVFRRFHVSHWDENQNENLMHRVLWLYFCHRAVIITKFDIFSLLVSFVQRMKTDFQHKNFKWKSTIGSNADAFCVFERWVRATRESAPEKYPFLLFPIGFTAAANAMNARHRDCYECAWFFSLRVNSCRKYDKNGYDASPVETILNIITCTRVKILNDPRRWHLFT